MRTSEEEKKIIDLFADIELDLIKDIVENLKNPPKKKDGSQDPDWESWRIQQLKSLEEYRKRNKEKYPQVFKDINRRTGQLFRRERERAGSKYEKELVDKLKREAKAGSEYDGKIDALVDSINHDLEQAEYAVLRKADDDYRRIISKALLNVKSGGGYEESVDMAVKDFLQGGIRCVVYKNGSRHSLEEYARMAIRTGMKRAQLIAMGEVCKKYGIHTVRVNKRLNACPLCIVWVGRVLVDDVYGGGTKAEARKLGYPTLSYAMAKGLYHPNCKDIHSIYIDGISRPAEPWTKKEIEELAESENAERQARRAETKAEEYRRLTQLALSEKNKGIYRQRQKECEIEAEGLKLKIRVDSLGVESRAEESTVIKKPKNLKTTLEKWQNGELIEDEATLGYIEQEMQETDSDLYMLVENADFDFSDIRVGNAIQYSGDSFVSAKGRKILLEENCSEEKAGYRLKLKDEMDKRILIKLEGDKWAFRINDYAQTQNEDIDEYMVVGEYNIKSIGYNNDKNYPMLQITLTNEDVALPKSPDIRKYINYPDERYKAVTQSTLDQSPDYMQEYYERLEADGYLDKVQFTQNGAYQDTLGVHISDSSWERYSNSQAEGNVYYHETEHWVDSDRGGWHYASDDVMFNAMFHDYTEDVKKTWADIGHDRDDWTKDAHTRREMHNAYVSELKSFFTSKPDSWLEFMRALSDMIEAVTSGTEQIVGADNAIEQNMTIYQTSNGTLRASDIDYPFGAGHSWQYWTAKGNAMQQTHKRSTEIRSEVAQILIGWDGEGEEFLKEHYPTLLEEYKRLIK